MWANKRHMPDPGEEEEEEEEQVSVSSKKRLFPPSSPQLPSKVHPTRNIGDKTLSPRINHGSCHGELLLFFLLLLLLPSFVNTRRFQSPSKRTQFQCDFPSLRATGGSLKALLALIGGERTLGLPSNKML
ncbi:hypothetical protein E2C01_077821 [Portunus trituberculatus]|uniref:Uncharacterized protein n=1 Tax=Portunus trituberculatus TaxID=210409 RepID=A0A5B7IQY2_PORTR|nr:hypothetical protein [Portunus trituberculatus]